MSFDGEGFSDGLQKKNIRIDSKNYKEELKDEHVDMLAVISSAKAN